MIYANYGRQQDFNWLKKVGVSVAGCVVVMRVGGGVSFAEKVWLAERHKAGGVLIYPDPADLPQDPRRLGLSTHTAVSEHVMHTHTQIVSPLWINQHSCLCQPITGPPGLRRPLHPRLPLVQSYSVSANPIIWPATHPSPANQCHCGRQNAQVSPAPSEDPVFSDVT